LNLAVFTLKTQIPKQTNHMKQNYHCQYLY